MIGLKWAYHEMISIFLSPDSILKDFRLELSVRSHEATQQV